MTITPARLITYSEYLKEVHDADVALCSGHGLLSRGIQVAGRSGYSHAAILGVSRAFPREPIVLAVESREWVGVRAVNFTALLDVYPWGVDVYRPYEGYGGDGERREVFHEALRLTGGRYGWRDVARASVAFVPGVRLLRAACGFPDSATPDLVDHPAYCSAFVSIVLRLYGGIDPVPNRNDRDTLPGDLATTTALTHLFKVIADPKESKS